MPRILPFALAALLSVLSPAGFTALAQQDQPNAAPQQAAPQQAAPQQPAPEAGSSQPNWPPGLGNWEAGRQQPQGGNPNEAEQRGLTTPEVKQSQEPPPTEQGTRPPTAETTKPTAGQAGQVDLYALLNQVRRAPPGLDGKPIPRPNPLGSEPAKEMQPDPAGNPEHFFPKGYIE